MVTRKDIDRGIAGLTTTLIQSAQALRDGKPVAPGDADDLRSLGVALAVERMIRDGVVSESWPPESAWSAPSR